LTFQEISPSPEIVERLRRANAQLQRVDVVFEQFEHSVGLWTGSSSPCERQAQSALRALMAASGSTGVFVADPAHAVGSAVAYLRFSAAGDWSSLLGSLLDPLSAAVVVAESNSWCVAWSDDDYFACGAAAHLVEPFRAVLCETFSEFDTKDVDEIVASQQRRAAPSVDAILHYDSAIRWAYPVGHAVRDAWDRNSFIRKIASGGKGRD
jgi:hypothetical protein